MVAGRARAWPAGLDDNTVRLWDAASGRERHRLEGHSNAVLSVAWSPDGASVASGSSDNTVRLWDAASGREQVSLEGHRSAIELLAWSADSRVLASVSQDGEIRLWEAATGQLLDRRRSVAVLPDSRAGISFGSAQEGWETEALTIIVWTPAAAEPAAAAQVLQASAKVILAGDSSAGKTCLARRLAEDAYESGQSSTHGMQVWTLAPEKLHPGGAAPPGQSREIFRLGSRRPE